MPGFLRKDSDWFFASSLLSKKSKENNEDSFSVCLNLKLHLLFHFPRQHSIFPHIHNHSRKKVKHLWNKSFSKFLLARKKY